MGAKVKSALQQKLDQMEYKLTVRDQIVRWSLRILLIPPIILINVLQYFALSLLPNSIYSADPIFWDFVYKVNWSFWILYPVCTLFDLGCILFIWWISSRKMMSSGTSGSSYIGFGWFPWIYF